MIGDVLHLMLQSDVHRKWYVHDLERLVMPAIEAGKMKVFYRQDDGSPCGLYSHAFLTRDAAMGYMTKTRKLQPEDWFADHDSGDLFVIDLIAPYDNGYQIGRMVQLDLTERYIDTYPVVGAFTLRGPRNNRLNFVPAHAQMLQERSDEVRA